MRIGRVRRAAVGVVVALAALTGCSSEGGGDFFPGQSAEQILASAHEAYNAATSVRIAGTLALDANEVTMDLRLTQAGDGQVSVTTGGLTVEMIQLGGQAWFRSPNAWQQISPEVAQAVGDRWVLIAQGTATEQLATTTQAFSNKGTFGDQLFTSPSALQRVDGEVVNGVPTIGLRDNDGVTVHIAAEGQPFPLLITPADGQDQTKRVTFSNYSEDLGIVAPADAITDLQGLIASTLTG